MKKLLLIIVCAIITASSLRISYADDLSKKREVAKSDDAQTAEESDFHFAARSLVIRNIKPNDFNVGGDEFRVRRSPVADKCFVYDPRTEFFGVKRNLIWLVTDPNTAYALNSPSKIVTPELKWPHDDGIYEPSTSEMVAYVFDKKPIAFPKPIEPSPVVNGQKFTVKEYKIYRTIIDTPMSVSEAEAIKRVAKTFGTSASDVERITRKVMQILKDKYWYGSPESEIKHASDWKG